MSRKITIIIGHPDPSPARFCRVLANAYARGAAERAHEVSVIDIAQIDFPLLRSQQEWQTAPLPEALTEAHCALLWADHLVIIYPLWLGDVPAKLKAFLEQVFRPGETVSLDAVPLSHKPLSGKSARVIVTMGMPAWVYRWFFGAHSLKSLKRNVLSFVGFSPVRHCLIGMIEAKDPSGRQRWLQKLQVLGRDGR